MPDASGESGPRAVRTRYTGHARRRMAQRGITEAEVETVLGSPEIRYHDKDGNDILVSRVANHRIKVVVAKGANPPLIITAAD